MLIYCGWTHVVKSSLKEQIKKRSFGKVLLCFTFCICSEWIETGYLTNGILPRKNTIYMIFVTTFVYAKHAHV